MEAEMIQTFTVEIDTGSDDDKGVTVEEIERLLVYGKGDLGIRATFVVIEEG
jgi:hypothetical protein